MTDEERIQEALDFATKAHDGQFDDDGLPYIMHPKQVYSILKNVTSDVIILQAALLHDILEDTNTVYYELWMHFGYDVAELVYEVTHAGKKDEVGYYFPNLKTKEAILIKFADRLSNLSRMNSWDDDRQKQYLKKSKFWKTYP